MRTPKDYTDNIKKGIITKEMLSDCLYSVNKRAKNCRDKEREYRHYRYDYYGNEEKYRNQKEAYYEQKEKMLSLLTPNCIHAETIEIRQRIYDYEYEDYDKHCRSKDYFHEGGYYDRDLHEFVEFIDVMVPEKKYYLFYDLGNHSFHTPIYENEIEKYPELKIEDIDSLITFGNEISSLISTQFVQKVMTLIENGNYSLVA